MKTFLSKKGRQQQLGLDIGVGDSTQFVDRTVRCAKKRFAARLRESPFNPIY
jgi:hypothetical protein